MNLIFKENVNQETRDFFANFDFVELYKKIPKEVMLSLLMACDDNFQMIMKNPYIQPAFKDFKKHIFEKNTLLKDTVDTMEPVDNYYEQQCYFIVHNMREEFENISNEKLTLIITNFIRYFSESDIHIKFMIHPSRNLLIFVVYHKDIFHEFPFGFEDFKEVSGLTTVDEWIAVSMFSIFAFGNAILTNTSI